MNKQDLINIIEQTRVHIALAFMSDKNLSDNFKLDFTRQMNIRFDALLKIIDREIKK